MLDIRKFSSMESIHAEFPLAIKLKLDDGYYAASQDYDAFYDSMRKGDKAQIQRLTQTVRGYGQPMDSVGVVLEVPIRLEDGSRFGVQYLVIHHESGLEILFQDPHVVALAATAGAFIVKAAIGGVATRAAQVAFAGPIKRAKRHFHDLARKRIAYLELRTLAQGRMILPIEKLRFARQGGHTAPDAVPFIEDWLACVLSHLHEVRHLRETNETCFRGHLLEVNEEPRDF